ncbi:dimethylarginine dimethylaminohydrolase family protein [Algibacter mikhailovii]|uniref:dimethylarginine dimethylaminohydrolase family protein n=1 Tax=Algibacter mikhailovii TaxID=425498 RepID=UPI002495789C|nr:arginine deiminase family protein [Algibacter mikhailovii]
MKTIKKLSMAALIGVGVLSAFKLPNATDLTKDNSTMKSEHVIRNNHEWDQLEEVVVGRWEQNSFNTPEVNEDLKDFFPYITDASFNYMKKGENKSLAEVYPEDDKMYHEETENLVKTLEGLGVKVRRPDEMEFPVTATTQIYSRDPIVTIGNKFILTNMYAEQRRQESANYRRIALDLAKKYDGEVISMPANKPGYHKDNVYLEGGDLFVDGYNIYVGVSGNASNDKGIAWLQNELGNAYTVHKIPLQKNVLHLDCAMMLINEKQGIICKEDFVDFDNVPDGLKNREWVEVTPEEAQIMATNGVVVNKKTVILSDTFPHIAKKVRDMGIEVHEIQYKKGNYFGGGLRCSYQPITRK